MNYQALLLGAQAAGIGTNLLAGRAKRGTQRAAIAAERSQLELRMEQDQLAFKQANIASLEHLNETLATQRAIQGARGTAAGQGSALAIAEKSIRNQKSDEKALALNKIFRENQTQGLNRLLNIREIGASAEFGASMLETGINTFSLNTSIGKWLQGKSKSPSSSNNFVTKNKSPYSPKKPPTQWGANY